MKNSEDKIKKKIKSLFDLGEKENNGTAGEISNAIEQAKRLMEKYSITFEDLNNSDVEWDDYGFIRSGKKFKNRTPLTNDLAIIIGAKVGAEVVVIKTRDMDTKKHLHSQIQFTGHKVDIQICDYIYYSCLYQFELDWAIFKTTIPPKTARRYRRGYEDKFVSEIGKRLDDLYENFDPATSTELVVVKNELAKKYLDNLHSNISPAKQAVVSYNYYKEAAEAAKKSAQKVKLTKELPQEA